MNLSKFSFTICLLGFIIGMAGLLAGWHAGTAYGLTVCILFGILGAALSSRP